MYRRILHFSENFKFLEGLLDSWKAKIGVALGISALISLLECRCPSGFGPPLDLDPPGPNPLADIDLPVQIR